VGERAAPTAGALAHGAMPPLRGTMVSAGGADRSRQGLLPSAERRR